MGQLSTIVRSPFQDTSGGYPKRASRTWLASPPDALKDDSVEAIAELFETDNFLPFHRIEMHTRLSEEQIIRLKPKLETYLRKRAGEWSRVCVTSRVDLDPAGLWLED